MLAYSLVCCLLKFTSILHPDVFYIQCKLKPAVVPQFKIVIPIVLLYIFYFLKIDLYFFIIFFAGKALVGGTSVFQKTVAWKKSILLEFENGKLTFLITKDV